MCIYIVTIDLFSIADTFWFVKLKIYFSRYVRFLKTSPHLSLSLYLITLRDTPGNGKRYFRNVIHENVRSDVCHTIPTKHQLYRFTSHNRVTQATVNRIIRYKMK